MPPATRQRTDIGLIQLAELPAFAVGRLLRSEFRMGNAQFRLTVGKDRYGMVGRPGDVVGVARGDWTDDGFRIALTAPNGTAKVTDKLLGALREAGGEFRSLRQFRAAVGGSHADFDRALETLRHRGEVLLQVSGGSHHYQLPRSQDDIKDRALPCLDRAPADEACVPTCLPLKGGTGHTPPPGAHGGEF